VFTVTAVCDGFLDGVEVTRTAGVDAFAKRSSEDVPREDGLVLTEKDLDGVFVFDFLNVTECRGEWLDVVALIENCVGIVEDSVDNISNVLAELGLAHTVDVVFRLLDLQRAVTIEVGNATPESLSSGVKMQAFATAAKLTLSPPTFNVIMSMLDGSFFSWICV
jgi:hypothetical protein